MIYVIYSFLYSDLLYIDFLFKPQRKEKFIKLNVFKINPNTVVFATKNEFFINHKDNIKTTTLCNKWP